MRAGVSARHRSLANGQRGANRHPAFGETRLGASPASALVVRGNASKAVAVVGMEPALYYRIIALDQKMVRGTAQLGGADLLVGTDLATDLGVDVGDKLRLSTAAGAGATTTLRIAGLFDLGNRGANARNVFVALHTGQSLLALPGGVTSLDVAVDDVYTAEAIAQRITTATGVEANSWIRTNAELFTAISAQNTSNTAIRFFVGLSVAFGIASVLAVVVVQKSREIGILRAMGISQGQVLRLFLLQGGLLGLGGAVAGCGLGVAILVTWQRSAHTADGSPLFALVLEPSLFAAALGLATVTGLVAAYAPARRAARLDPVEAIGG